MILKWLKSDAPWRVALGMVLGFGVVTFFDGVTSLVCG